jgi:DNA-binding CsgD family transcriptional regulator
MQTEKIILLLKEAIELLEENKPKYGRLDKTSEDIIRLIEKGICSASEIGRLLGLSRQYISRKVRTDLIPSGYVKIDSKGNYRYIEKKKIEDNSPEKPRLDKKEEKWH